MKTQTVERDVVSHGYQESRKATIKASAHAFNILSSGLYSDKIRAVLRELSTNAYDAHVEAGKADVPFYVKMPTNLDPTFKIRDYGVGLSHEDAMELYNTYFQSTKNDTNDAIGALGLGSKSPYSYTNVFSVVSYHNGMKRVYNSGLDEEGCPACNFVYEEPTDEVNGLEVSFAVSKDDFREFNQKASYVLRRFNPLPNVVGYMEEVYNPVLPEVIMEGKNWRLTKGNMDNFYRGPKQIAIMGNIEYPIDRYALTGDNENGKSYIDHDTSRIFGQLNIELDFEIGELEIAASREGLGYTQQTSQTLADRINNVVDEIFQTFQEQISQAKNYREACRIFNDLDNYARAVINNHRSVITYDEKHVSNYININFVKQEIKAGNANGEEAEAIHALRPRIKEYYFKRNMNNGENRLRCENHDENVRIKPEKNNMIIVDDVRKRTTKRVVRWNLINSEYTRAYVIDIPQEHPGDKLLKTILEYIDCDDEIFYISQMEDEPKEERSKRTTRSKLTLYHYAYGRRIWDNRSMKHKVSHQWDKVDLTEFDSNDTYYYVPVVRYMAVRPDSNEKIFHADDFKEIACGFQNLGYDPTKIYGISKSQIQELSKLPGDWINLYDEMKKTLQSYTKDKKFIERLSNAEATASRNLTSVGAFHVGTLYENISNIANALEKNTGSLVHKYSKKLDTVLNDNKLSDQDKVVRRLLRTFGMTPQLRDEEIINDLHELAEQIREKYELLWDLAENSMRFYDEYGKNEYYKKVANYVKQMDELAKCKGSETS